MPDSETCRLIPPEVKKENPETCKTERRSEYYNFVHLHPPGGVVPLDVRLLEVRFRSKIFSSLFFRGTMRSMLRRRSCLCPTPYKMPPVPKI